MSGSAGRHAGVSALSLYVCRVCMQLRAGRHATDSGGYTAGATAQPSARAASAVGADLF